METLNVDSFLILLFDLVARVTALTCQWLMGSCEVNSVDLPDGTTCQSGVII